MPEGPSIVILKELMQPFTGKKVLDASGIESLNAPVLINKKLLACKSWGKHFLLCFATKTIRIHFLLFGSYSFNEQIKPDKSVRLSLKFKNGTVYFYTCSIKELPAMHKDLYNWSADVLSEEWNPSAALKKAKLLKKEMVCDVLLDQEIFSGVGNIIKNEVLYRIKVHPKTLIENLPLPVLKKMVNESNCYSLDFLKWKKNNELKKHWLAYHKKMCLRCNLPIIKLNFGKKKRNNFYCNNCQVLYK